MLIGSYKCNRVECHFLVDEGIQCNICKRGYRKVFTGLSPAAYKLCCTVTSHWMCKTCCSPKLNLIREVYELLSKAMELPDDSGVRKGDIDCLSGDEAVSVIMNFIPPVITTPVTPDIRTTRSSKCFSKCRKDNKTKGSISLSEKAIGVVFHERRSRFHH